MITDDPQWYVQKGSRVQGPFSAGEIGRFLLLGRVRNTDRVSRDGELWEPVTQVPELIPEELLDLESGPGWERFLDAREAGDERLHDDTERRAEDGVARGAVTDRRLRERRAQQPGMVSRLRAEWLSAVPTERRTPARPTRSVGASLLPWSLLGITVAALGVVLWLNGNVAPPT